MKMAASVQNYKPHAWLHLFQSHYLGWVEIEKKGASISSGRSAHTACFDSAHKRVWGGSQWPLMAKVKVNRGPGGSTLSSSSRLGWLPKQETFSLLNAPRM